MSEVLDILDEELCQMKYLSVQALMNGMGSEEESLYGYLKKYNPKGKVQKRFCIINKGTFFYYRKSDSSKPSGFFKLAGYQAHVAKNYHRPHTFTLEHQNLSSTLCRSYVFSCVSEKEKVLWIDFLNHHVASCFSKSKQTTNAVETTSIDINIGKGIPETPARTPIMDRKYYEQQVTNLNFLPNFSNYFDDDKYNPIGCAKLRTQLINSNGARKGDYIYATIDEKLCEIEEEEGYISVFSAGDSDEDIEDDELDDEVDNPKDLNLCDDYYLVLNETSLHKAPVPTLKLLSSDSQSHSGKELSRADMLPTLPIVPPALPKKYPAQVTPESCFLENIERDHCTHLLCQSQIGTYLIRTGRVDGKDALAVLSRLNPARVKHYIIFINCTTTTTTTTTTKLYLHKDDPLFKSLEELIKYYHLNCLPHSDIKLVEPYSKSNIVEETYVFLDQ